MCVCVYVCHTTDTCIYSYIHTYTEYDKATADWYAGREKHKQMRLEAYSYIHTYIHTYAEYDKDKATADRYAGREKYKQMRMVAYSNIHTYIHSYIHRI